MPVINIGELLGHPSVSSTYCYKKHVGGRSFFIIHCHFSPALKWTRPLTLSQAHKPVRQCKLNFTLVSVIKLIMNNEILHEIQNCMQAVMLNSELSLHGLIYRFAR